MSDPTQQKSAKRSLKHHILNRILYAVIAAVIFGALVFFIDGRFNPVVIFSFMAIFFLSLLWSLIF